MTVSTLTSLLPFSRRGYWEAWKLRYNMGADETRPDSARP